MKKKYWILALILFAVGLFFYFCVYAYQFTGIMLFGLGVVQLIFGLLKMCKRKIFFTVFCVCLVVGTVAMIGTGIWVLSHMSGSEDVQTEYVIVLGAGVRGDEPSASLYERLTAAEAYAHEHPNAILILTGAQGERENISEAQCMYNWLTERGISPERLRVEEKATTTEENILYSVELIEKETGTKPTAVGVISSEYHLLRASLIAEDLEITAVCHPAKTRNKLFFCNMLLREIFAVWKTLLA